MAILDNNEVKYAHYFDRNTKRHYLNNVNIVLHCHHYTALYTQLALDADETELLEDCSREAFRTVLQTYFAENPGINTIQQKIEIGCQYFSLLGLGKMKVNFIGEYSGEAELLSSHTDSGWLKKWGKYDKPVNYIAAGYVEALFEIALGLAPKSFKAIETQSIVMGAETSIFKAIRS